MEDDVLSYYRLLRLAYRRYLGADARLTAAREEMRLIFPPARLPYRATIGERGSRIRRLSDERDMALLRLQSALDKFKRARARAARRPAAAETLRLLIARLD